MRIEIKNDILFVNFDGDRKLMNLSLSKISNKYEGYIKNREGHNFSSDMIPRDHFLYKYKCKCKYVVGIYNTNALSHEMLHAKFYLDPEYRRKIEAEWLGLSVEKKEKICRQLEKMGYRQHVFIDEYQAYQYADSQPFFSFPQ